MSMDLFVLLALLLPVSASLEAAPSKAVTHLAARETFEKCTTIPSPSPGSICGQPQNPEAGTTGSLAPLFSSQYLDFNSCVDYCAGLGCIAISYDKKTRLCSFFGEAAFESDSNSTTLYYDFSNCFTCSKDCNMSSSGNHFFNQDFNDSNTLIGPWNTFGSNDYEIVPNPDGPGNALQFTFTQQPVNNVITAASLGQFPIVCEDQGYSFSLDYKIDQLVPSPKGTNSSSAALYYQAEYKDCVINIVYNFDDERLGKWQRSQCGVRKTLEHGVATPVNEPGVSVAVLGGITPGSPAVTWNFTFANLRLTGVPNAPVKTRGASLLRNGGFESGKVAPWRPMASYATYQSFDRPRPCNEGDPLTAVVSPGLRAQDRTTRPSKYHLSFCGVARSSEYSFYSFFSGTTFMLSQALTAVTEAAKTYVMTIQYAATNGTSASVTLRSDSGSNQVSVNALPNTNGTVVYQRIFSGLGPTTNMTIEFRNGESTSTGPAAPPIPLSLNIDNISIKEVEE